MIQNYQLFPIAFLEETAARVVPWVEFFLGVFVALGLGLQKGLVGLLVLTAGFIIVVSQAILRGLPVDHCGCFGETWKVPLPAMVILDTILWLSILLLLLRVKKAGQCSLDRWLEK